MKVKVEYKVHYRIGIIGWHTGYLAVDRAERNSDNAPPSTKFLCTSDTPSGETYRLFEWREFNCPHIVTATNYPRPTIEIWEERQESEAQDE